MKQKIEVPEGYVLDSIDKATGEAIFKSIEKLEQEKREELLDAKLHLSLVYNLQQRFPTLIIGGSISLYLQGVRLKRFETFDGDLDLVLPYYQLLEKEGFSVVEELEDRPSGSDYGETILINGVKADIRIDPTQKYKILEYKGCDYKVIPLETIIEAKARYAKTKWGKKHKEDLKEMILNKTV